MRFGHRRLSDAWRRLKLSTVAISPLSTWTSGERTFTKSTMPILYCQRRAPRLEDGKKTSEICIFDNKFNCIYENKHERWHFGFDRPVLSAVRQRLHQCEVNVSVQIDLSILATADIGREAGITAGRGGTFGLRISKRFARHGCTGRRSVSCVSASKGISARKLLTPRSLSFKLFGVQPFASLFRTLEPACLGGQLRRGTQLIFLA